MSFGRVGESGVVRQQKQIAENITLSNLNGNQSMNLTLWAKVHIRSSSQLPMYWYVFVIQIIRLEDMQQFSVK
ncbi:hypothetical protein RN22_12670 [Grimontia sp. AD028]|nr:hypothetical protein RN22_12670 [Grimontia sp. AD028]